jgi:peptidoglycan-associated lipoprotein
MTARKWHIGIVAIVALLPMLAGCAKQPPTTPPPTTGPVAAPPTDRPPSQDQPPTAATPTPPPPRPAAPEPPPPPATTAAPPLKQPPQKAEEFTEHAALRDVLFEPGRVEVGPIGTKIMRENARWLIENPGYLVLIEGHTDYKGRREANVAISERRAKAAMKFLIKEGVPEARITIVGYGSERPVCPDKTESCAAKNRRVHFLVKPQ